MDTLRDNIVDLVLWLLQTSEGLTLLIACVTAWAAWESRKMGHVMQQQYQASMRPLLGMSGLKADPRSGYAIILENHGQVITKHTIKKMLIDGEPIESSKLATQEYITFPNEQTYVFLGLKAKNGSTIDFQIEYQDASLEKPTYITERRFSINGNTTLTMHSRCT